jgi:hypothetical protein
VGKEKQERVAAAPPAVREIAWKAQCRLSARYRALTRKGKLKTVAVTAVARELSAFIWAINRQVAHIVDLPLDMLAERPRVRPKEKTRLIQLEAQFLYLRVRTI